MSKIGKLPIKITDGVTVSLNGKTITVKGTKGEQVFSLPVGILVSIKDGQVSVSQEEQTAEQTKALYGLVRATIANMITGVSKGFEKQLELSGVGYRAQATGDTLTLSVGFSHPVKIKAQQGITFAVKENTIIVSGFDKTLVGNTAAQIRAIRPPEPYKGKGITYKGERIRRKAGKAAKAVGAK